MHELRWTFTMGGTLLAAFLIMDLAGPAQASGPVVTVLHSFASTPDGAMPGATLTVGAGGVLFGTTTGGGAGNLGTVFSLSAPAAAGGSWTEAFYSLPGGVGGRNPSGGGVVMGPTGLLYGTANEGGASHNGIVFQITPPAVAGGSFHEKVIYQFAGSDGNHPAAGVVIGSGGVLYGTTYDGGSAHDGTVFSLTPPGTPGGAWTEAVLHSFSGRSDGRNPNGSLLIGSGGVLYGTTGFGGASGKGTVFSLTPPSSPGGSWTETTLYSFTGASDGGIAFGPLLTDSSGALYGTAETGGATGNGAVFALTPPASPGGAWTEAVLYGFGASGDGSSPMGIVFGPTGVIYGCTQYGGVGNYGTVFSLTPPSSPGAAWTETVLHSFNFTTDGSKPFAAPVFGTDGLLYGTTYEGGTGRYGTVYSLQP